MSTRILPFLFAAICSAVFLSAHQPTAKKADLYLLIGQSNMAGRGVISQDSPNISPNIRMLNNSNAWVIAQDPLHADFPKAAGVGPGLAFAREMERQNPGKQIGLIPCAVGGTSIDEWQPELSQNIRTYIPMMRCSKK
ncbi:sialate O-acetylesterase [Dyadobacter helix]|nr:sialate O-acetylesterase [Dyadobacter sp. CECT 9275]